MNFFEFIGISAGIISFLSYGFYYVSIFRKKTQPSQATWLILTFVSLLILISYYTGGARDTIWVPASYVVGAFITYFLSLKYGQKGWSDLDKWCLFFAAISLVIWWLSGSALLTLLINIFIDFLGMTPTIVKSYYNPNSEEKFPWTLTFIANVLNIMAINEWQFSIWIYPIYMVIINGLLLLILYTRFSKSRLSLSK